MANRKKQIAIICEGFEEKPFLDKILFFPYINKDIYEIGPIVNAKGNGSIFPKYQDMFSKNRYDLILIFCDADKGSNQFIELINKINNEIFGGIHVAEKILIFVNPVTLQIVLSNFEKIEIKHISKAKNQELVKKLTGIENYSATQEQIDTMMKMINTKTYLLMKENIKSLSTDMNVLPSSNFLDFLNKFENNDTSWIDDIIDLINGVKKE